MLFHRANNEPSWGFYGRSAEQAHIERILASGRWFFCAISGRRRIGKTTLIQRALQRTPHVKAFYFQVPDSDERGVVETFRDALEDTGLTQLPPRIRTFRDMARLIRMMCEIGIIVVIDEFQYFHRKSLLPFASHLQAEVDKLRDTSKGGLFVLGSIHTEMTAILEDHASPLFNRVTHKIAIGHWDFDTLFEMFSAHGIIDPHQQLFLWSMFEGVPKFYRDCFEAEALRSTSDHRKQTLRRLFFEGTSPLRDEAANWFLHELRGRYDSVLKLLAKRGSCSYGELVSDYGEAGSAGEKQLSQYLQSLVDRYGMVERRLPIFVANKSRKARYEITDNFLAAWLHGIARNVQIARIQPVEQAVAQANRALETHEGFAFEKMVRQLTEECSRTNVGDFPLTDFVKGYWNRADGSDIEIDFVAVNEGERRIRLGACKRNPTAHDSGALTNFEIHVKRFLATGEGGKFTGWAVEMALFSPAFSSAQRERLGQLGYLCRDIADFAAYLGRPIDGLFGTSAETLFGS